MSLIRTKWMLISGLLLAMAGADCKCTQEGDGGSGGGGSSQSCPFVFTFDGQRYNYLTDLGGSVLGKDIQVLQPEYYHGGIYRLDDFQPHEGIYSLKIRETLFESSYFDEARLIAADAPSGYQVLSTWSFTSQLGYTSPKDFMTVHDPRPPKSAVDEAGTDVLYEISHADGQALPVGENGLSRVVVDFGEIRKPQYAKLILTAWSQYDDFENVLSPPYAAGTTIETMAENGRWRIILLSGKNAGDRHSWVVDLSGLCDPGQAMFRITMAHQPIGRDILDQILMDESPPVDVQITRLSPSRARLQYSGRAYYIPQDQYHPIMAYDQSLPLYTRALLSGWYTRYGDVKSLLDDADDRFAIMAHGDSILLDFQAPPVARDRQRTVFLDADVFYSIKYDVKENKLTDSIYPLPFHGMTRYPYEPRQWPHEHDSDYLQYDRDYNTRLITAEE